MTHVRRAIGSIAIAWLLFQGATLALVPVALWSGVDASAMECTCSHGDHAICPMHHKPAPGSKLCLLGNGSDDGVPVLTWLSVVAPLPARLQAATPEPQPFHRSLDAPAPSLRPARPDPPPPRA